MGFSLMGFGAGLAESAIERIEEERKFSNLALQGRIERASVLKMQREKEAEALKKELLEQKASLQQFGIDDPEVQKAYLTAPTLAEALKKSLASGEVKTENANQYARQFANINKDKLGTGTVDEFIANATRAARGGGEVEPARVMPTEGGSIFAPSVSGQQRRLQQLASARGMTLEDVARAESPAAMSRPEPAASINLEMLKKPDNRDWKAKLVDYQTKHADAVQKFGEKSPEAIKALNALETYTRITDTLTKDQFNHAQTLSRSLAIVNNPRLAERLPPEEVKAARDYVANDEARQLRMRNAGKDDDKIPNEPTLASLARQGISNAVRLQFGGRTKEGYVLEEGPDKSTVVRYTKNDKAASDRLIRAEQDAVITALSVYMPNGKVQSPKVEAVLNTFGIKVDENRIPRPIEVEPEKKAPEGTPGSRLNEDVQAATARPGVRTGRTIAPAPAPAAAPQSATQDRFVVGQEYKDGQGRRAKYLGNGQWQPL